MFFKLARTGAHLGALGVRQGLSLGTQGPHGAGALWGLFRVTNQPIAHTFGL